MVDAEPCMPMALFLLGFQAAAAPPPPPAPVLELDFDLARLRVLPDLPGTCDRSDPSAIIVCARRGGAYPLAEMARIFDRHPHLAAEVGVAGSLTADVHLQSVAMDRGAVSNRIMIGLRLPF